ncbi:hypothetical protein M3215_13340 [Bacillus cytotoxicus]|uniref:Uncharacterized protein n=1 Tax=Bacillus cytotoxicus TaxID=580165 RepID=A0ACC6A8G8_9BACI|nr:hypothetical protein [Bacillus cytotoxicus]
MTLLIILGYIFLVSISNLKSYSIHVTFKIASDNKTASRWSFVNKLKLQTLKELLGKQDFNKLKNITIGELSIPVELFNKFLVKTIILIILFLYRHYFG